MLHCSTQSSPPPRLSRHLYLMIAIRLLLQRIHSRGGHTPTLWPGARVEVPHSPQTGESRVWVAPARPGEIGRPARRILCKMVRGEARLSAKQLINTWLRHRKNIFGSSQNCTEFSWILCPLKHCLDCVFRGRKSVKWLSRRVQQSDWTGIIQQNLITLFSRTQGVAICVHLFGWLFTHI